MGRQYGRLLGPQIRGMYYEALNVSSNTVAMIAGMSETSEMSEEEICTINEFFSYFIWMTSSLTDHYTNHCSAITAWGNYTGGMPLVMGRDFDSPLEYKNMDKYITIIVLIQWVGATQRP